MKFNWLGINGTPVSLEQIITYLIISGCIVWTIVTVVQKIAGFFNHAYKTRRKRDELKETVESDHDTLERLTNTTTQKIDNLSDKISELSKTMKEGFSAQKADIDETTVASYRSSIYRMHKEFMAKGEVSNNGLKTFSELVRIYEKHGGNDIVHSKLAPEVLSLPIKEGE